jgi:hypothetical protein
MQEEKEEEEEEGVEGGSQRSRATAMGHRIRLERQRDVEDLHVLRRRVERQVQIRRDR